MGLLHWSTSLTEGKLPRNYIKSTEVYANKALKIKSAYHYSYRQISNKNFTTQIVSLNSCDLFLTVLVYMQEQQNYSLTHKTWHICIKIVSNSCSRISFKDTHRKKAPSNKMPVLSKSMIIDISLVGTSNQLFVTGFYTETKIFKN